MADCTCGTEVGGSADRRIGTDVSDSAYLHCTTASLKPKDLVGIPWRVAFALQADGWYLRSDIIWAKPNPMPESVTDRCTKAHEYVFLMAKSERYYFDADAIAEQGAGGRERFSGDQLGAKGLDVGGRNDHGRVDHSIAETRNARSVWTIATQPYPEAHFATFPPKLAQRCILAGTKSGDTVLDPFYGAGTTGLVAKNLNRLAIGIELNAEYCEIAARRCAQEVLDLAQKGNPDSGPEAYRHLLLFGPLDRIAERKQTA